MAADRLCGRYKARGALSTDELTIVLALNSWQAGSSHPPDLTRRRAAEGEAMRFDLSEDQREFRGVARAFFSRRLPVEQAVG